MTAQIGLPLFTVTAESLHMAGLRAVKTDTKTATKVTQGII